MYSKSHYFDFFNRSQIINITTGKNVQCALKHNEQGNARSNS